MRKLIGETIGIIKNIFNFIFRAIESTKQLTIIIIGIAVIIMAFVLFNYFNSREKSPVRINSKIAELACLKIRGKCVIVEKQYWGAGSKGVFVYDVDATLSVNLAERKKEGNILILPQPQCTMFGINHNMNENKYRKSSLIGNDEKMEKSAAVKAQNKIRQIASQEDVKKIARQHAEIVISTVFYPGENIVVKWGDDK